MSHFFTLVLISSETKADAIKAVVTELLEPYSENKSVPEYTRPCSCVGWAARCRARQTADAKNGGIDALRNTFVPPNDDPFSEENDDAWVEHLSAYNATEKEAFDADKDKNKADPTCEECHGVGTYMSTYNPQSKWDWWSLGGRWDGVVGQESCLEGSRSNIVPVRDLRNCKPFAIVTPDGQWHERGKMGWFGQVSQKRSQEAWEAEITEIFQRYPDHLAVGCDLHI